MQNKTQKTTLSEIAVNLAKEVLLNIDKNRETLFSDIQIHLSLFVTKGQKIIFNLLSAVWARCYAGSKYFKLNVNPD